MEKKYLFSPGPTMLPSEVLLKMAEPIMHHREPEFEKIFAEIREDLKYLFQTKNEVLVFTSSGTGAMEGAVSNILSKGDKAVVVRGGKFGERWGEICKAYGVEFIPIDVEWGRAVDPEKIQTSTILNAGEVDMMTDSNYLAAIDQSFEPLRIFADEYGETKISYLGIGREQGLKLAAALQESGLFKALIGGGGGTLPEAKRSWRAKLSRKPSQADTLKVPVREG